ncbi:uncharacterized protein [Sinocyclocheilus grahami]|uniref:uncharacterized protein n=1 Tax=Sinocyclocheilus grahami TaxID=75366 RepID=UPI0007AD1BB8|nr:PREDICTED: uncharacterized protein LOC107565563 [Sinocyclocheilus grahami]
MITSLTKTTVKRIDPALVLGPVRPLEALTPSLRAHTLLWFERTQLPRLHRPGQPLPRWLHGFATRREAEQLLKDKPQGCFLLRLSESKIGFALSYRSVYNGSSEVAERPSNLNLTGDQISPVDVQYARVNKPPRAVSENTPNFSAQPDLQGAIAAFTPPSISNFDTTAANPKYWKLEHTYEEPPHTHSRLEEIDCYAVGWRRQAAGDEVNLPKNHLYSEVNIRGAQDSFAVPRPGPSLPLRPPPRSAHGPLRPELSGQSFGVSSLMTQPQHSDFHHSEEPNLNASSSSIYEQIPERPTSSRACLPPPNHKR